MKIFVHASLAAITLVFLLSSCATPSASGTAASERGAILEALRVPVEKDLRQKVVFKVERLTVRDGWAYLRGVPQMPGGKRMNYQTGIYREQVNSGAFEDSINALLKKRGESWTVVTYNIGATDVVYLPWAQKYRAPAAIFE